MELEMHSITILSLWFNMVKSSQVIYVGSIFQSTANEMKINRNLYLQNPP